MGWSQTVRRELVHRAAVSEVLLTSISEAGPNCFVTGAQWPRAHVFYGPDRFGRHDSMLVPESLRQAGIAIAHSGYGVPFDRQFLMGDMWFAVSGGEGLTVGGRPTDVSLRVEFSHVRRADGALRRALVTMSVHRDQEPVASAAATMVCLEAAVYRKLRSRTGGVVGEPSAPVGLLPPVEPVLVGREQPADVVLGRSDGWVAGHSASWPLRFDASHPILFDHPVDHVPGMAQLEAFRQAAFALTTPSVGTPLMVQQCQAKFHQFAEMGEALWCSGERNEDGKVAVSIHRLGQAPLAEGQLSVE
ncbi:MAG: ScbA/BarX family gamma-butyrolactone biosynthesis protein [Acidimicrobiales bacterium]